MATPNCPSPPLPLPHPSDKAWPHPDKIKQIARYPENRIADVIKRDRRGRAFFPPKYYSVHSAIGSRINGMLFRSFRHGNTKMHPSSQVNESNDAVAANIWSSISRWRRLLKCIGEVVIIDSIIIFHLSELRRTKFCNNISGEASWELIPLGSGRVNFGLKRAEISVWWHNTCVDLFTYSS